jgi:hypothetical protein
MQHFHHVEKESFELLSIRACRPCINIQSMSGLSN